MKEGYYNLHNNSEDAVVLVYGYYCADLDGAFVFGFNTADGGGLLPLSDLSDDSWFKAVEIKEV